MLNIYSSKDKVPSDKYIIEDVDTAFVAALMSKKLRQPNEISDKIMRDIDGVKSRTGTVIEAKFGSTTMDNLSTGCKACLLAANYPEYAVSTIEMGVNAIQELFQLSKEVDMNILLYGSIFYIWTPHVPVTYDGVEMDGRDLIDRFAEENTRRVEEKARREGMNLD